MKKSDTKSFITKSIKIFGDNYDYSKFVYTKSSVKSIIICPVHGEFPMTPNSHLTGHGCKTCAYIKNGEKTRLNREDYFERCNIKHNCKYDYSKSEFFDTRDIIIIGCPIHGDFPQNASSHLYEGTGCPRCNEPKGEREIHIFLKNNNIKYHHRHYFKDCKYKSGLPFDFYLIDYNLCIEFDGIQHYTVVGIWGGIEELECRILRDSIKTKYCLDNNIDLLRIKYTDIKNIETILIDKLFK